MLNPTIQAHSLKVELMDNYDLVEMNKKTNFLQILNIFQNLSNITKNIVFYIELDILLRQYHVIEKCT